MVLISYSFIMMLVGWHDRRNKIPNESGKHEGDQISEYPPVNNMLTLTNPIFSVMLEGNDDTIQLPVNHVNAVDMKK